MRIYLTKVTFESEEKDSKFYREANDLISILKKLGHEVVYVADDKFNNYEEIYKLIASCNCLLAITDSYSLSSTWRVSEITYASNGCGAFETVDFHIPVFLYKAIDDCDSSFLTELVKMHEVFTLPGDVNSAIQTINVTMKNLDH